MSKFGEAIQALRARGHEVEASDMIGLTLVDGVEMTIGQIFHVANFGAPDAAGSRFIGSLSDTGLFA